MDGLSAEQSGTCVVCQQVDAYRPQVCDRDRHRLAAALWELRDLHALLPYALVPGQGGGQRVGGTRERQLPLRTEALDLGGRANTTAVLDAAGDQVGAQAVASVLDSWAQDWAILRDGEDLPAPAVPDLVSWLSQRLTWACDAHPAVDEFARELTVTLYAVRTVLRVSRKPIYCADACPECGTAALRRQSGDEVWRCAECKAETPVDEEV